MKSRIRIRSQTSIIQYSDPGGHVMNIIKGEGGEGGRGNTEVSAAV